MACLGVHNLLCFLFFSVVRNSTPSLVKTEKKEIEAAPQNSPLRTEEVTTEKQKLEETVGAYNPITTR